jgi:tetratricopeptide (TPR) repeat protein
MAKKAKKTQSGRRRSSDDQKPAHKLVTLLKWVGGVTAVLSLILGLHQITQLVSDVRERERRVAELYKIGKSQQGAADYKGAWDSFERAAKTAEAGGQLAKLTGQLSKERRELREAQEDLAMEWLENGRIAEGKTLSDFLDELVPVLARGASSAGGVRKADMLAHVGWAFFLRSRDGQAGLDPENQYRQALEIDPANPYAHAYWGHWKLWRGGKLEAARQHFSAAIASGRAGNYVRRIQLAALKNLQSEQGDAEFLAVVNEMRKNKEKIDSQVRNDVFAIYYFAFSSNRDDRFRNLLTAVPAAEQLATFRALFYDNDFDEGKRLSRDSYLASLLEAAGQREEALRIWLTLRQGLPAGERSALGDRAAAALKRLSPRR